MKIEKGNVVSWILICIDSLIERLTKDDFQKKCALKLITFMNFYILENASSFRLKDNL
jgi:hypothetical protein